MSLLVCLRATDGLVLASDGRGTFGDPRGVTAQNDFQQKLYVLNPRVGAMVAGSGELGAMVMSVFHAEHPDAPDLGVTDLMWCLRDCARKNFAQWFEKFAIQGGSPDRPERPGLAVIVAGYEADGTTTKIYQLVSAADFAPFLHDYGFAVSGVAQYALYLLNRLYEPGCTVSRLLHLAAYAITETASQDGKVGGRIQMATVTPQSAQPLTPEEVGTILAANEQRRTGLRNSFFD
jgi:20S proteasome alpha/beta subunit